VHLAERGCAGDGLLVAAANVLEILCDDLIDDGAEVAAC